MSNYKSTPIPHRSKSGSPMAFYALSEDGAQTKVSRSVCLAPAEESGAPYPQRWFVDEESGLVVRLPRNAEGESLARENMRDVWREQKHQERKRSCAYKGTTSCEGWKTDKDGNRECDSCQRRHSALNATRGFTQKTETTFDSWSRNQRNCVQTGGGSNLCECLAGQRVRPTV